MWASSQSSTARNPSPSTSRLPIRRSPWTTHGAFSGGRFASSHRKPSSKAGCGSDSPSSTVRYWVTWSAGCSPFTASTGMAWIAAVAAPTCSPRRSRATDHSSSRSSLRAMVSPASRSTTIPALPSTPPSSLATTRATGTPCSAAARSRAASVSTPTPLLLAAVPGRSRCRISSCVPSPVDEVEGPRLSRRAARESPQPLDRRVPVWREQGPEGERQLVGPHETSTVGERPDAVPLGVRVASRRPLRTGTG